MNRGFGKIVKIATEKFKEDERFTEVVVPEYEKHFCRKCKVDYDNVYNNHFRRNVNGSISYVGRVFKYRTPCACMCNFINIEKESDQ